MSISSRIHQDVFSNITDFYNKREILNILKNI